ncbi:ComF family protein [Thermovirga sp.]|uniref:ComF family protein n=1 Tax=Thermovirga sp. TaxID=2699834 RepID=UPI0025FA36C7|nr:phosphoribosyltransferase family protein [Thermovirga sp.]MBO8153609.1 ComF family protein [Thermovirga sp.]
MELGFKTIVEGLFHLFWPVECPFCKKLGVSICDECLDSILENAGVLCLHCMANYPCARHSFRSVPLYWGSIHKGKAREVVHLLKYGHFKSLGSKMGEALARNLVIDGIVEGLVPVPLHIGSCRHFNQALEIAKGVGKILDVPVLDVLSWKKEMPTQVGRTYQERRALPKGAVVVIDKAKTYKRKRVMIVDDVCTTGMTLRRCREALEDEAWDVVGAIVWSLGGYGA